MVLAGDGAKCCRVCNPRSLLSGEDVVTFDNVGIPWRRGRSSEVIARDQRGRRRILSAFARPQHGNAFNATANTGMPEFDSVEHATSHRGRSDSHRFEPAKASGQPAVLVTLAAVQTVIVAGRR